MAAINLSTFYPHAQVPVGEIEAGLANCWLGRTVVCIVHEIVGLVQKVYDCVVKFLKMFYELIASYFQPSQAQVNSERELEVFKKLPSHLRREIYSYTWDVLLRLVGGDVERLSVAFQEDLKIIGQKVKYFDVLLTELSRRPDYYTKESKFPSERLLKLTPEKILKLLEFFPNLQTLDLRGYPLPPDILHVIVEKKKHLKKLRLSLVPEVFYFFDWPFRRLKSLEFDWLDREPLVNKDSFISNFFAPKNSARLYGILAIEELNLNRLGYTSNTEHDFLKLFPKLKKLGYNYKIAGVGSAQNYLLPDRFFCACHHCAH